MRENYCNLEGNTNMKRVLIGALVLLGVGFANGALARGGDRPVVAVAEFKNESGAGWWGGGVGWELSGMLSNELAATKDFTVVERAKIEDVLSEQNLAASGRVAAGTGARIGKLTGAQYLIAGTVTAYEENTASTGGGISFGGVSLGGNSQKAYLAVDLRVINATTGQIDFVRTIEGTSKGGGISVGISRGGFGGALSSQKNTPAGKAIRAALVEITDYLSCVMVQQNGCEAEYDAKEAKRRDSDRGALKLD
jgi:curli biogenesis system outer membrane secretion channel CsgG